MLQQQKRERERCRLNKVMRGLGWIQGSSGGSDLRGGGFGAAKVSHESKASQNSLGQVCKTLGRKKRHSNGGMGFFPIHVDAKKMSIGNAP